MKANHDAVNHRFYRRYGKRFLDFILSLIGIIVLSPLLLILAILVRVKHGSPILFTPTRPGKDERVFKLLKFRTMTNARDEKGFLLPEKERMTKFGSIMRKTSLDELPELFNILRGDMSFVGPRPLYKGQLTAYSDEHRQRYSVRPGLTGYAQINGRNGLPWDQRFQYDLDYVERLSFAFDVKVFVDTFLKVLKAADVTVPGTNKLLPYNAERRLVEEGPVQPMGENGLRMEIGGFWEETDISVENRNPALAWLPPVQDSALTLVGRGAIGLALTDLRRNGKIRRAYLPSYCSFGMVQPFIDLDIPYDFYPVDWDGETLRLSVPDGHANDVLLITDYFGMNREQTASAIQKFRQHGGVVIEDITQTLLDFRVRTIQPDYYTASLRKWFPLYSGGWLGKTGGTLAETADLSGDEKVENVVLSMRQKRDYMTGKTSSREEYVLSQTRFEDWLVLLDCKTRIDSASAERLQQFDVRQIAEQRQRNARRLFDRLHDVREITFLNKKEDWNECAPLCVPILLEHEQRNALKTALSNQGIYCPITWPERMGAPVGIKNNELSLPCDQRYTEEQMDVIANAVLRFFGASESI